MLAGVAVDAVFDSVSVATTFREKLLEVIVDVDPEFSNTEEWYQSIPADLRPSKKQPFYHLMAENSETFYSAYVSQQNIIMDSDNGPVDHPDLEQMFSGIQKGKYLLKPQVRN